MTECMIAGPQKLIAELAACALRWPCIAGKLLRTHMVTGSASGMFHAAVKDEVAVRALQNEGPGFSVPVRGLVLGLFLYQSDHAKRSRAGGIRTDRPHGTDSITSRSLRRRLQDQGNRLLRMYAEQAPYPFFPKLSARFSPRCRWPADWSGRPRPPGFRLLLCRRR